MDEYAWIAKLGRVPGSATHTDDLLRRLETHYSVRIAAAGPEHDDPGAFLDAARDAIQRRVAGVMMAGWEHPRILEAANAVVDAGIPLVTVDRRIPHHRGLAHVGTDWFLMGETMADRLIALLDGHGKLLVVGTGRTAEVGAGLGGFRMRASCHPGIETLAPADDMEVEAAVRRCLEAHPNLAGIAVFDGDAGPAAAATLARAGRERAVRLVCVDAQPPQLEHVRAGTIDAAFRPRREAAARVAFQMLYGHRHGPRATGGRGARLSIPGNVDTGFVVVTRENVETFPEELNAEAIIEPAGGPPQVRPASSTIDSTARTALAADTDLIDRRRVEEALRESEQKFRVLADQTLMGILILQDGRIKYVNQAVADSLEHSVEEMLAWGAEGFLQGVHPEDRAFVGEQARRRQADLGDAITRYAFRALTKSGKVRWMEKFSETVLYEGRPADLAALIDITDRKEAEEAQARLAAAVEQAGEAILIADRDGVIRYVNPAFEAASGYARAELAGGNVDQLEADPPAGTPFAEIWETIRGGTAWSGRTTAHRKDGVQLTIDAAVSPVRDAAGQVVDYVVVARDVTQEIAMRAASQRARKMEAIGHLAGGVAHDFNNLLTAILGNAQLLTLGLNGESDSAEILREIVKASHRAADLTRQLLAFARKGKFQIAPVDIHHTVREVAGLLSRSIDKRIELRLDLKAPGATIMGDPTQLESAVLNLGLNARDAMPCGGTMAFATRAVALGPNRTPAQPFDLPPGQYLEVSVSDTGVGMDAETQGHIFEPFFTTKQTGEGTGLGLAGVYGCVKSHGGSIQFDSAPGEGTTFRILLPQAHGTAAIHLAADAQAQPAQGSGCILIVDDEETVRRLGQSVLEKLGYRVLTAADGLEAVDIYRRRPAEIDLVLLDLVMPKLHGRDTFRQLREIDPNVRVLLTSGYSDAETAREAAAEGALDFLAKPFDVARLSRLLARHMPRY